MVFMQAILLSAGKSSRFWPLNVGMHKSLVKIAGKSLISRTIESIAEAGIKDILIVQSPSARIEKSIAAPSGVSLKFAQQPKPKGMGDAILCAKEHITGSFFVVNAYHFNAGAVIKNILGLHKKSKAGTILVGKKTDTPQNYGIFRISSGKAAGIVEKPCKKDAPSDIRAVGVYFLPKQFISRLEAEKESHYSFESALEAELKSKPADLIITEEFHPTLKYPWDLFAIEKYAMDSFLKNKPVISKTAEIDKTVKIKGGVYIGAGTKIMENAVIKGPCYIGENCVIGNNALLRSYADIGNNVSIGANTEVARSIIGEGTHIHSGYIGDSIIAEDCRIGAGFITSNARIDRSEISTTVKGEKTPTGLKSFGVVVGRGAKIGIGVKTMPGVLIGANSKIGPATVVNENVESDTTYYSEFKGIVKKKSR